MNDSPVNDIHDVRGLLEGAVSIHDGVAGTAMRDHQSLIEDFVRLIRDFDGVAAPVRRHLVAA